jgi:hypothetical protein
MAGPWPDVPDGALAKPPTPPARSLFEKPEVLARQAVELLYSRLSGSGPLEPRQFGLLYADLVAPYYGKSATREEVLADKGSLANRWGTRRYRQRWDETKITRDSEKLCVVAGPYDWEVKSAERKQATSGASRSRMVVSVKGQPTIVSEWAEVIKSHAVAFTPDAPPKNPGSVLTGILA